MMCAPVLHSDLNCFYASVEMNEAPSLKGLPVAVCGSTENRHGIVLTASYPAKRRGVKTGMANWEAKQVCPELTIVPPRYDLYQKYSKVVRKIYARYSDYVEPFGMDECWIALPPLKGGCEDGRLIAEEIRETVFRETGLTVSIGVSFNKVFAKLGSDMKKPDAVTVIDENNYREKVWPLPASDLLYVGRATTRRLARLGIHTIGDIAEAGPEIMRAHFGKNGDMLWHFAAGLNRAPVQPSEYTFPVQSVGHGTTCVRDLTSEYEVWRVLYALSRDVSHRLHKYGMLAGGVQLTVKDEDLEWTQFQATLPMTSRSMLELSQAAFDLFRRNYDWKKNVRALTIRGIQLRRDDCPEQTCLFNDFARHARRGRLEDAVDDIRNRFGNGAIMAASLMGELHMAKDGCETVTLPGMMYR